MPMGLLVLLADAISDAFLCISLQLFNRRCRKRESLNHLATTTGAGQLKLKSQCDFIANWLHFIVTKLIRVEFAIIAYTRQLAYSKLRPPALCVLDSRGASNTSVTTAVYIYICCTLRKTELLVRSSYVGTY